VTRALAAVVASLNTQIEALEAEIAAQLAAHADGPIFTSLPARRRLAHPRLAPHHQRPPAPGTQILDQAVERLALPLAVHQRRGRLGSRMHACPTPWQLLAR
jgi:hypothetical protein